MRDSDLSGVAGGLTGAARLCRRLEPWFPTPESSQFTLTGLPDALSTQTPPER